MALTNLSQITTSGIATGTDLNIRNITGAAATFTGNVTVGGTLTYEDVTNIDSVGLITARSGINVTGGDVSVADKIVHTGDTDTSIRFLGPDTITAETAGSERLRITNSGLVGIGTVNPTTALEIRTTTTNAATHYRNNASNSGAYFGVRGADLGAASAGEAYVYSYNSGINLLADGSGHIDFATGGTASKVRITSAGKVGINETSPDSLLHLTNNAGAGIRAGLRLENSGTNNSPNDTMGEILFAHNDSNDAGVSASIVCKAEDAAGNTYLQFNNGKPSALVEHLRITSGGNIGIGTVNAVAKVDIITGTGDGTQNEANCLRLRNRGNNGNAMTLQVGVNTAFAGALNQGYAYLQGRFWGGGNNPILLNPKGGNVGIGRTSAHVPLDVNGDTILRTAGNTTQGDLTRKYGFTGPGNTSNPTSYIAGVADQQYWYQGLGLVFGTVRGNDISNTLGVERMRITSDGKVGIGTDNPQTNLQVQDASEPTVSFWTGSTKRSAFQGQSTGTYIYSYQGQPLLFSVGSGNSFSEKLRITSAGKVGINSTAPATAFDVVGQGHFKNNGSSVKIESVPGTNFTQIQLTNTGGSLYVGRENNAGNWFGTGSNYASVFRSDGSYPVIFRVNGANRVYITPTGQLLHGVASNSVGYNLVTSGANYHSILVGSTNGGSAGLILDGAANGDGSGSDYGSIEHVSTGEMRYKNRQSSGSGGAGHIFYTTNSDTERLRITSDGKIGINNSAPLYAMHFKNAMSSSPSFIHMEVTGSNVVGGGGGIAFDTSASNSLSSNSLYLATIKGIRNSSDDGSNDLVFSTTKAGATGDDGNVHSPKERLRIDSEGRIGINANPTTYANSDSALGLLIRNGASGNEHTFLDIQNEASESGRIRFIDGDNGIGGQIYFSHNTQRDGVGANYMGFFTGNNVLRMQVTTSGVNVHGSTDGVLNLDTTDGRGSFVRFQENGTTKTWVGCAEGMGGGLSSPDQDDLGLRATGKILFSANGAERLRIDEDGGIIKGSTNSATSSQVIQTFFNKRGSCMGKRIHHGSGSSSTTHDLLTINSWQSSNTRLFAYVTVHYVNPVANLGGRMETYAAANYGGTRASGTFAVADGGRWGNPSGTLSLSWSTNTLQLNTFNNAYMEYSVDITYVAYDGAVVTFATN